MNLAQVHGWVVEAGEIALRLHQNSEVRRKPDRSIVTSADEQIERLLRAHISAAYPDHMIVGEEHGRSNAHATPEYAWAIDPIDGTSAFVQGLPHWGISIGLLERGVPVLGCFFMPLLGEWYEVDRMGPALLNGQPIQVGQPNMQDSEAWICAPSNVHRRYRIAFAGKLRVLGSVAAYLAYVARGNAMGALIGGARIWDLAGTLAVLQRAGGDIRYLSGAPIHLQTLINGEVAAEPIIAGSPASLALLQQAITLKK